VVGWLPGWMWDTRAGFGAESHPGNERPRPAGLRVAILGKCGSYVVPAASLRKAKLVPVQRPDTGLVGQSARTGLIAATLATVLKHSGGTMAELDALVQNAPGRQSAGS